jgi:large subunit ribosomal protein L24
MKIRKWDTVKIISWKQADKGLEAEVLKVFKDKNKVLVKGVNIATRHIKKMGGNPGQIIKMEKPISISNVMLVCPFTGWTTRVWYVLIEEKGKQRKFRFSKKALKEKGGKAKDFIIK